MACYDIDRRFGIDDAVAGRRSLDLYDPQQLREAVVLMVLYKQYLDQSRQVAGPAETSGDSYAAKARIARAELDEVLDRLSLKWNEATVGFDAVKVWHCNDAKAARGSKLDRHEHIGEGTIGAEAFRRLLRDDRFSHAVFIAETPVDNPGDEARNVTVLRTLAAG